MKFVMKIYCWKCNPYGNINVLEWSVTVTNHYSVNVRKSLISSMLFLLETVVWFSRVSMLERYQIINSTIHIMSVWYCVSLKCFPFDYARHGQHSDVHEYTMYTICAYHSTIESGNCVHAICHWWNCVFRDINTCSALTIVLPLLHR